MPSLHMRLYYTCHDVLQTPEDLQWECKSLDTALEGEESKESCLSEVPSKRAIKNKELFDIGKILINTVLPLHMYMYMYM